MLNKIMWLRISYWVGIVLDAGVAVAMLFPQVFLGLIWRLNLEPNTSYICGIRYGAPLMIGWTILLLWADRKPIERMGILFITACPVVLGLLTNNIFNIISGLATWRQMAAQLLLQTILMILFTFSYLNAKNTKE